MIKVKKLQDTAHLPERAHKFDAGADLRTPTDGISYPIGPGERRTIGLGIALEVPPGYVGLIHPRSGLAAKHGITVLNTPGTVDAEYRGELKVILYNSSSAGFVVVPGMRIAQLIFQTVALPEFYEADTLDETARGSGGLGSTGFGTELFREVNE